jgi:hypothetical protein
VERVAGPAGCAGAGRRMNSSPAMRQVSEWEDLRYWYRIVTTCSSRPMMRGLVMATRKT